MAVRYFDITLDLKPEMAYFPGDPAFRIEEESRISQGDQYNLSLLTFGSHTGTHMDAPKHLFEKGATVEELPLDHFLGKAKVFEIENKKAVSAEDLNQLGIKKGDIVLLKTGNSAFVRDPDFHTDYVYVAPEAARYLVGSGVKTLGFDYLSVDAYQNQEAETHRILLAAGVVILEGLDLSQVEPGEYEISALPIRIKGGNGSPVRAVLLQD